MVFGNKLSVAVEFRKLQGLETLKPNQYLKHIFVCPQTVLGPILQCAWCIILLKEAIVIRKYQFHKGVCLISNNV